MFPVCDVIPTRTRPLATIGLVALNALAFAYQLQLDESGRRALAHQFGVVAAAFTWPSLVTSLVVHASWLHVGANVVSLWLFGASVEDRLGRARFLLLYAGGGLAAALAHVALQPASAVPVIGSTGAVGGVVGAYLALYPQSRMLTAMYALVLFDLVEIPAILFGATWLLLQAFTERGSVGADAATGSPLVIAAACGCVAGGVTGLYWRFREQARGGYWRASKPPRPTLD